MSTISSAKQTFCLLSKLLIIIRTTSSFIKIFILIMRVNNTRAREANIQQDIQLAGRIFYFTKANGMLEGTGSLFECSFLVLLVTAIKFHHVLPLSVCLYNSRTEKIVREIITSVCCSTNFAAR